MRLEMNQATARQKGKGDIEYCIDYVRIVFQELVVVNKYIIGLLSLCRSRLCGRGEGLA